MLQFVLRSSDESIHPPTPTTPPHPHPLLLIHRRGLPSTETPAQFLALICFDVNQLQIDCIAIRLNTVPQKPDVNQVAESTDMLTEVRKL